MLNPALFADLCAAVGKDQVLTETADCWPYGYDNSRRHALPEAVVFATTHEQVRDCVRLCNRYATALVARGRGTGTTGATVPLRGGVVLSLDLFDRILAFVPANRVMVVEPGGAGRAGRGAAARRGGF